MRGGVVHVNRKMLEKKSARVHMVGLVNILMDEKSCNKQGSLIKLNMNSVVCTSQKIRLFLDFVGELHGKL